MSEASDKVVALAALAQRWIEDYRRFDSGMYGETSRDIYETKRRCAEDVLQIIVEAK